MTGLPIITQTEFEDQVLQASGTVLVDFYADWCGPCKALVPSLTRLAGELQGRVNIVKVNIDTDPELAEKYGVDGVPTLLVFQKGREKDRMVGAAPLHELRSWLNGLSGDKSAASILNAPWLR